MANILLVNPPTFTYSGMRYFMNPTLALPYLSAVLKQQGHSPLVLDCEALGWLPAQLVQFVLERQPDAIGFTSTTMQAEGVCHCISALRGAGITTRIVVGGSHAEFGGQEFLDHGADLIVLGEGENVVEQAMVGTQKGWVPADDKVNVSTLPLPNWHDHIPKLTDYRGNEPRLAAPEGIAMWSRGCPHDCVFCGSPYKRQPLRLRPGESIAEEVKSLRDTYGIKSIFIYDDELLGATPAQSAWLEGVCGRLISENLNNLVLKCQGRCSTRLITPELMEMMYAAGFRVIMWGIESFSQKVLDAASKRITPDDVFHSLRVAKKAGLRNWLFLMVGNLEEGVEELAKTECGLRQLIVEGLVDYRQVTIATPLPGTKFYDIAEKGGWLKLARTYGPAMHLAYMDTPWLTHQQASEWKMRLERA